MSLGIKVMNYGENRERQEKHQLKSMIFIGSTGNRERKYTELQNRTRYTWLQRRECDVVEMKKRDTLEDVVRAWKASRARGMDERRNALVYASLTPLRGLEATAPVPAPGTRHKLSAGTSITFQNVAPTFTYSSHITFLTQFQEK